MFYFPLISSGYKCNECENEVNKAIVELKDKLERLVHWEDTFNQEVGKDEVAKHQELLDVVNKLLEE